jgi:hypothetical protein
MSTTAPAPTPVPPALPGDVSAAIADLSSIFKIGKAATKGAYPWESGILLLLSAGGAIAGVAVPGIAPQVRDVLTAVSGLVLALTSAQRHVTARKAS